VPEGVLAYTQRRSRAEAHRANNPAAFAMPLVVLIDGETASAAEVVAAALKERGRATLVGQPTYGKNSMQDVFRLKSLNAGLQITLARFCSPAHAGFDGRGVTPDRPVERYPMSVGDAPRDVAFQLADGLARMVPR
jgi:carboxyl-terminal processing protease